MNTVERYTVSDESKIFLIEDYTISNLKNNLKNKRF